MFGQGKYTDSDGETHRVKDIPEFGRRGGTPRVPGYVAAAETKIAQKKHAAQLKAKAQKKAAKKAKREGK